MPRRIAFLSLLLPAACFVLAQNDLAGAYKGKWTGMSASGDFSLRLDHSGSDWKATVQFTLGDNPIPTQIKNLRVTGTRVEVTYEFDLGGNKLQSQLEGDIRSGQLTGKYKTKTVTDGSPVDEGTCEAKRSE